MGRSLSGQRTVRQKGSQERPNGTIRHILSPGGGPFFFRRFFLVGVWSSVSDSCFSGHMVGWSGFGGSVVVCPSVGVVEVVEIRRLVFSPLVSLGSVGATG